MIPLRHSRFPQRMLLAPALLCALIASSVVAAGAQTPAQPAASAAPTASASPADALSPTDYRAHLQALDQLISACENAPSPATCRSDQVGPDLKVAAGSATRQVRLAWLRGLLDEAKDPKPEPQASSPKTSPATATPTPTPQGQSAPNQPAAKPSSGDPDDDDDSADDDAQPASQPASKSGSGPVTEIPTHGLQPHPDFAQPALAQQMQQAHQRIAREMEWTNSPAPATTSPTTSEHQRLTAILAAREYQAEVVRRTWWDVVRDAVGNWINRLFAKLSEIGAKSKWWGYASEIGFGLLVLVALAWFLIRLERQSRLDSAFHISGPGAGAASARDWQLWLQDASKAAADGSFRDAIHLLYWASISRLESSGQWPADRARTPREYLALLAPESAQRGDLAAITRSFERTWYGGRDARETDFRSAEQIAARLGASSSSKHAPRLARAAAPTGPSSNKESE